MRGERLRWYQLILLWVGLPFRMKGYTDDDSWIICRNLPPVHEIKDEVAQRRMAQARAMEEAKAKANERKIVTPSIPSRRR